MRELVRREPTQVPTASSARGGARTTDRARGGLQAVADGSPPVAKLDVLQRLADDSAQVAASATLQRLADDSSPKEQGREAPPAGRSAGLPAGLRSSVESLSGLDMSDVSVHRNSAQPAQVGALAYTKGTEIHLGPGQDRHLPHEAWHVVQQKQGRVRPQLELGGHAINSSQTLEREADAMADRAARTPSLDAAPTTSTKAGVLDHGVTQLRWDPHTRRIFKWHERINGVQWFYIPSIEMFYHQREKTRSSPRPAAAWERMGIATPSKISVDLPAPTPTKKRRKRKPKPKPKPSEAAPAKDASPAPLSSALADSKAELPGPPEPSPPPRSGPRRGQRVIVTYRDIKPSFTVLKKYSPAILAETHKIFRDEATQTYYSRAIGTVTDDGVRGVYSVEFDHDQSMRAAYLSDMELLDEFDERHVEQPDWGPVFSEDAELASTMATEAEPARMSAMDILSERPKKRPRSRALSGVSTGLPRIDEAPLSPSSPTPSAKAAASEATTSEAATSDRGRASSAPGEVLQRIAALSGASSLKEVATSEEQQKRFCEQVAEVLDELEHFQQSPEANLGTPINLLLAEVGAPAVFDAIGSLHEAISNYLRESELDEFDPSLTAAKAKDVRKKGRHALGGSAKGTTELLNFFTSLSKTTAPISGVLTPALASVQLIRRSRQAYKADKASAALMTASRGMTRDMRRMTMSASTRSLKRAEFSAAGAGVAATTLLAAFFPPAAAGLLAAGTAGGLALGAKKLKSHVEQVEQAKKLLRTYTSMSTFELWVSKPSTLAKRADEELDRLGEGLYGPLKKMEMNPLMRKRYMAEHILATASKRHAERPETAEASYSKMRTADALTLMRILVAGDEYINTFIDEVEAGKELEVDEREALLAKIEQKLRTVQ